MGKIGEFLNNKPWHPSSRQNQTLLFEAEERQREEQQRLEERQEELKQERAREELDALLPNRGGAKPAGIDFMYKAPTGTNTSGAAPRSGAHDEAALAFEARRLAAARRKRGEPEPVPEPKPVIPEPVIPEPEPEPERPSKTFDAHAEARRVDPAERQRNLTSAAIAQTALDARNRLVLKAAATAAVASDGVVRAHGSGNEGYALLDDEDAEEDADAALLASLSSREKRALLKRLAGDDDRPKKKRKKKEKKKSKSKKKKKRRSSSSSSSS